eukprot:1175825-Prorocentrum_minimum.AAC.6
MEANMSVSSPPSWCVQQRRPQNQQQCGSRVNKSQSINCRSLKVYTPSWAPSKHFRTPYEPPLDPLWTPYGPPSDPQVAESERVLVEQLVVLTPVEPSDPFLTPPNPLWTPYGPFMDPHMDPLWTPYGPPPDPPLEPQVAESERVLVERLVNRQTELVNSLAVRVKTAREELARFREFDYGGLKG